MRLSWVASAVASLGASLVIGGGCAVLDPFPDLDRESPGGLLGDSGAGPTADGAPDLVDAGAEVDASTNDSGPPTGKLAFIVTARSEQTSSLAGGPMVSFAPNGDAVMTFTGHEPWTVGNTTFPAPPDAGKLDVGFIRVDPQGGVKIARRYDFGSMENTGSSAVTANGDAWLAGYRYTTIDETSAIAPFVAKFDVAGDHVLSAPLTSTATASWFLSRVIRIGKNGGLYWLANYRGTVEWTNADGSPGTVTSSYAVGIPSSTDDIFVARLDPSNGRVMWWKTIGGTEYEFAWDLAVDAAGDVYLAAQFESASLSFPAVTRVGARPNALVAKLSGANGAEIWSHAWGDTVEPGVLGPGENAFAATKNTVTAHSIDVDEADHVVVGGNFRGNVDFGGGVTTNASVPGFFVTMLDAKTGTATWMREGRGTTGNGGQVHAVGFDRQGYLVAMCHSKSSSNGGTGTFAGQPYPTAGISSVLGAKMAVADGSVAWTKTIIASTGNATAYGVAVAPSGRSIAGMIIHGTADLGDGKPISSPSFAALVGWDP